MAAGVNVPGTGFNGAATGVDLLRLFLKAELSTGGALCPTVLNCRHCLASGRPDGQSACLTAGTKDLGKAQGFVRSDLKGRLRRWLKERTLSDADDHDEEVSDESSGSDAEEHSQDLSVAITVSSFDPDNFPSSTPLIGSRKSTKARVMVLTYLGKYVNNPVQFKVALKELCSPDSQLNHLCGCGISSHTLGACVNGDHLELGDQKQNVEHTHIHTVLRLNPSGSAYRQQLSLIKGKAEGKFDALF